MGILANMVDVEASILLIGHRFDDTTRIDLIVMENNIFFSTSIVMRKRSNKAIKSETFTFDVEQSL